MKGIANSDIAEQILAALGEQLAAKGDSYELVVIGGSGLLVLGLIERATQDVDLVALRVGSELEKPDPLPTSLREARDRETRTYGNHLTVHFASRFDQVHFKLYAAVDAGPGKHSQDLEALAPASEELLQAARWTRTHDPSPGFEDVLRRVLAHYGVDDAGI